MTEFQQDRPKPEGSPAAPTGRTFAHGSQVGYFRVLRVASEPSATDEVCWQIVEGPHAQPYGPPGSLAALQALARAMNYAYMRCHVNMLVGNAAPAAQGPSSTATPDDR